ncbi:putative F-box/LRR-repeat protein At3g28410 [Ziziphus jujuba]|uniref:F-box/LRR-repeat protein At3g28410 n=1 Tax=Ziziphus jujuba TaxID=326968 RepID=A0ABM4A3K9_ZIZJJ|nr:putative F-box/LRR-repeat protein At3g28410 [Ziziphus jujuba]
MATKSVEADCGGTVDKKRHTMSGDQISQLSDLFIHHIFSFLPTIYLVRISILSKHWRQAWVSTPFSYSDDLQGITFYKNVKNRDMVLKFMTNYLRYRKQYIQIPDTFILSFRCDTGYNFSSSSSDAMRQIDDWLNFVVKSKVKELDLHVKNLISGLPLLERLALQSHASKSFSIRSHSLRYVSIASYVLEVALAVTEPNLIHLHLEYYAGLTTSVDAPNTLEASLSLQNPVGVL